MFGTFSVVVDGSVGAVDHQVDGETVVDHHVDGELVVGHQVLGCSVDDCHQPVVD